MNIGALQQLYSCISCGRFWLRNTVRSLLRAKWHGEIQRTHGFQIADCSEVVLADAFLVLAAFVMVTVTQARSSRYNHAMDYP
jgi:hypothetical protein